MVTVISIILYFIASYLAVAIGVEVGKYELKKANVTTAKFAICSFVVVFIMAAALQVAA